VEPESELCINLPSATRAFLGNFFALSDDAAFEYIVRHSCGVGQECESLPAAIDSQILINTYMYHIFDLAWEDIWRLLRNNSFKRFSATEAFEKLVTDKQRETTSMQLQMSRKTTTTTPPSDDIITEDPRTSVRL